MIFFRELVDWLFPRVELYDDELFGALRRVGKGNWKGETTIHNEADIVWSMSLEIEAGEGRPTVAQREIYKGIIARYGSIWDTIADAIASIHPQFVTVSQVNDNIDSMCLLTLECEVSGEPLVWSLVYSFNSEQGGDMGYIADFAGWEFQGLQEVD